MEFPVINRAKVYAYITDWNSMKDAQFLAALLQNKIRVRYSEKPFSVHGKLFESGSLIIINGDNKNLRGFSSKVTDLAAQHKKIMHIAKTGFVDNGKDFGSPDVKFISNSKIALLGGSPASVYSFGEIWHFFEQQLKYPISTCLLYTSPSPRD